MIKLIRLIKEIQGHPKALILAGAPGAGKGSILKDLDLGGLKIFNMDDMIATLSKEQGFTLNQKNTDASNRSDFMKAMHASSSKLKNEIIPQAIENKDSFVLDGTSASYNQTKKLKDKLESSGYKVMMLYVYTDLETSLDRNEKRFEKSKGEDRSLVPAIILKTWLDVTTNFEPYKELFGNNFVSVANTGENETLKDLEQIVTKYVTPFIPKDGKKKDPKQLERSKKQKQKVEQDIQNFFQSNKVKDIINSSVSTKEAQSKLTQFLS